MTGTNLLPLDILEFVSQHGGHPIIQEIVEGLDLRRNTAYRAITELEQAGWVKTSGRPKRVAITPRLTFVASGSMRHDRVRNALFPNAVDVATQTGWITNVCYYDNGDAIYTDNIEYYAERLLATPFGSRLPAASSAGGRVLLAYQPDAEVERVASMELPATTSRTKVKREDLLAELRATAQRGYSVIDGELVEDMFGLGVAVFDESGAAVGAISTATRGTVSPEAVERCVQVLRRAAERASRELGYMGHLAARRSVT